MKKISFLFGKTFYLFIFDKSNFYKKLTNKSQSDQKT